MTADAYGPQILDSTRGITRRAWLASLPALALLPGSSRGGAAYPSPFVTSQNAPLRVSGLHSATLAVSDVGRSRDFYQRLFGCPVQARHGSSVLLRIGDGPRFLALTEAGAAPPRIDRFGMAVQDFDPDRVVRALVGHGLEQVQGDGRARPGPMQVMVIDRGDTSEVFFGDPHGLVVQLQDARYCGGSGARGDVCGPAESAPGPGAMRLLDLSHFTNNARDPEAANAFYQRTFGTDIQAYQARSPLMGVGSGDHFLMFIGGGVGQTPEEAARHPGRIHHVCLTVADFTVAGVRAALEEHGIRQREGAETGPLLHWVTMRMPDRGGAPDGTPEYYFSDPDGLSVQLQDPGYCGGGGYLGEICE